MADRGETMNSAILSEPRQNMGAIRAPGRCVVCASRSLSVVLDLGQQPLANGLLKHPDDPAPTLPLRLASCSGCGHVQLADFAAPEAMFSEYVFRTGASEPAKAHFWKLAEAIAETVRGGYVCEVGSNDGTLLTALRDEGLEAIGVDPCSVAQGVEGTVNRYFGRLTAQVLLAEHGPACCVVMCNVLAHAPDPYSLLEGARDLLPYGGMLVIEAPYLFDLLAVGAWDTIYHEHFGYFSASVLHRMLTSTGFMVDRVDREPVHGGSLRVWARRVVDVQSAPRSAKWTELLRTESYPEWAGFQARVDAHASALKAACDVPFIVAYGAAAKATVLLNRTGIRPRYIVDSTPDKQGCFIPGTETPIVPPSALKGPGCVCLTPLEGSWTEMGSDYVALFHPFKGWKSEKRCLWCRGTGKAPDKILITAWNYAEHIMAHHTEYAGRWIVPSGPHRTVEFH